MAMRSYNLVVSIDAFLQIGGHRPVFGGLSLRNSQHVNESCKVDGESILRSCGCRFDHPPSPLRPRRWRSCRPVVALHWTLKEDSPVRTLTAWRLPGVRQSCRTRRVGATRACLLLTGRPPTGR
eukprot:1475320-Prymnesium_polylepis.1